MRQILAAGRVSMPDICAGQLAGGGRRGIRQIRPWPTPTRRPAATTGVPEAAATTLFQQDADTTVAVVRKDRAGPGKPLHDTAGRATSR